MAVVAYVFVEVIGIDGDLRVGEDLRRIAVTREPDSCLISEAQGGEGVPFQSRPGRPRTEDLSRKFVEARATRADIETSPLWMSYFWLGFLAGGGGYYEGPPRVQHESAYIFRNITLDF
jgi:hypothetical protein